MVIFGNILRKNQINIYIKTHNFSKFSQRSILLNPFAMQYNYTLLKNYLHPSVKSCNVCAFVAFCCKRSTFPNFETVHFSS